MSCIYVSITMMIMVMIMGMAMGMIISHTTEVKEKKAVREIFMERASVQLVVESWCSASWQDMFCPSSVQR